MTKREADTLADIIHEVFTNDFLEQLLPGRVRLLHEYNPDQDVLTVVVMTDARRRRTFSSAHPVTLPAPTPWFFGKDTLRARHIAKLRNDRRGFFVELDRSVMRAVVSCHFAIVYSRGGYC